MPLEWVDVYGRYLKVMIAIEARFKSGNAVQVERAHITASEWAVIEEYNLADEALSTDRGMEIVRLKDEVNTIRAELVRLAHDNAELRARESALWSSVDNAQLRAFIEKHGAPHPLIERAERAESELAELKRRIAEAPVVTGDENGLCVAAGWNGVRVRLLLDDGESA